MIHTHPPEYNDKSDEDTSSIKGWTTGLGMPIEMVIGTYVGDIHYRCLKNGQLRRGFRHDTILLSGGSQRRINLQQKKFANIG